MKKKLIHYLSAIAVIAAIIITAVLCIAAAQPAMTLGSGSTLFYSAPGIKTGAVGSLTEVGTTSEAVSIATTIDSSRHFTVYETSSSAVIGGSATFTYSGAVSGADEYLSVIITDKTDKIVYYGKLKQISSAADTSGAITMTIPPLSSAAYNLHFFSEKCSASGDVASNFSDVSLLVYPDPYITTIAIPATTQGVNYSYTLQAASSSPNLTWSISSGSLPQGLYLNSATGVISGSPTRSGDNFSFTVQAKANGKTNTRDFTMQVNPPMKIEISSNTITGAATQIEVPIDRNVTLTAAINQGTQPYSRYQWMVNSSIISGATELTYKIPTSQAGTFIYTFAASDLVGANATADVTVIVRQPILPTLSISSIKYDRASLKPISFTKSDGDYPFSGNLKIGSRTLVAGTDFTLSGNTITINESTLRKLDLGDLELIADYDDTTADPKIALSVIDTSIPPKVGTLTNPNAIKRGEKLSLVAPSVTTYGADVTSQGWKIKLVGASDFVNFDPASTLDCSYTGASLYFYATNAAGTSTSNTVTITVAHTPTSAWQKDTTHHWHLCPCGEKCDVASHSCTADGTCTVCGHVCTHIFNNYKSDNNATCSTDGTMTRYCTICNYRDTVTDPNTKKGHEWSVWQVSNYKHWHVCTTCGSKTDESDHVPGPAPTLTTPQRCTICGMLLADKLPPESADTTTSPDNTDTTTPPTSDTTTPPDGTDVTTPPANTPSDTDTTPSDTDTQIPGQDVTTPPTDGKATIELTRDPDDTDQAPSFTSDTNLLDIIIISINNRPLTKDEYTISSDSKHITLHPSAPLPSGNHTLTVDTETAHGELTFTIGGNGTERSGFPFWLLWVVPHVLADIAGLICIAILIAKRKNDDEQEDNEDTDEPNITDTDSDD